MTARVAVVILAGGQSRRFFGAADQTTKVVARLRGVPLVRIVATSALRSRAVRVVVVTGPAPIEVAAALHGLEAQIVHNADFTTGMASSLQAGLKAIPNDIDGLLVMLADMPLVTSATLDKLIAQFEGRQQTVHAIAPWFRGERGNPVLVGRRMFKSIQALRGDEGARGLLSSPGLTVDRCDVDDPGVLIDIDTAPALDALNCGAAPMTVAGKSFP